MAIRIKSSIVAFYRPHPPAPEKGEGKEAKKLISE